MSDKNVPVCSFHITQCEDKPFYEVGEILERDNAFDEALVEECKKIEQIYEVSKIVERELAFDEALVKECKKIEQIYFIQCNAKIAKQKH